MAKRGETRPWKVYFEWASGIKGKQSFDNEESANMKARSIRATADFQGEEVSVLVVHEEPTARTSTPRSPRSTPSTTADSWSVHLVWGGEREDGSDMQSKVDLFSSAAAAEAHIHNALGGAATTGTTLTASITYTPGAPQ